MLSNAALPDSTLTNAKLQVIALAKAREKSVEKRPILLSHERVVDLCYLSEFISNAFENPALKRGDYRTKGIKGFFKLRQKGREAATELKRLVALIIDEKMDSGVQYVI